MSESGYDLAVIGGGLVGLATSWRILKRHPGVRLAVVEKEAVVAAHQSGHNTGVIHAGIYYRPGSYRAILCREGKADLERFALDHGIPFRRCGKIIVALEEEELPRIAELARRAAANGVEGIEVIGPERIREIEPHVKGLRALYSPGTGVIDFRRVALAIAADVEAMGGAILTGRRVEAIVDRPESLVIRTPQGDLLARGAIACAGLHSDRVAALTGDGGDPAIVPFRGDYYAFRPEARPLVRALVNPVPDPRFPFLGVHLTRREDGEVWAGPNAVLAFAREGYSLATVSARDLAETLAYPGFWRLIRKYMGTGLREMWRDAVKSAFVASLQRYLPELKGTDLVAGPTGVRAQALDRSGALLDDFAFSESARVLHVRNAPSPAATSSLAIGRFLADKVEKKFALT